MTEQPPTTPHPAPAPTPATVRGDGRLPSDMAELDLDAQADALETLHTTLQARLSQDGG